MKTIPRCVSLAACLIVSSWPVLHGVAADAGAGPGPKPDAAAKSTADTIAARLTVSSTGVTEIWLHVDARSRGARPLDSWNRDIRFGLKLQGPGPVYHEFEVKGHGANRKPADHVGTVTVDPKQQWVVIDLQEVVSKPGETRRTEPCAANGRYPVEVVNTGANAYPQGDQRGAGPTASELAVPVAPNGPYVQPK